MTKKILRDIPVPLRVRFAAAVQDVECWKIRWEQAERDRKEAQEGCKSLRFERDAAVRDRNEAIVRADMPNKKVEQDGVWAIIAFVLCALAVAIGVTFMVKAWMLDTAQNVQWRIVPYTVHVTDTVKPTQAIGFIKEASALLESGHRTRADMLLHDAVSLLESDNEGDPE